MKKNLLKSFLGLFSLAVGMTASAAEVTETYDFATAMTGASGNVEITLTDQAVEQEGTFNPSTVYVMENPVIDGKTMELNGRFALNNVTGGTGGQQMRWLLRNSSSNAYQLGLGGNWNGNGTAVNSYNISILDVYAGDKITIAYEIRSGKDAQIKAVKAGALKAGDATVDAGAAIESGTTYEVVADGTDPVHVDLAVTNDNMAIHSITIVTQEKEAEPEPEPEPEPQPGGQTSIYERGTTTAWSDADLAEWTGATLTLDPNNGIGIDGNQTYTATKTLDKVVPYSKVTFKGTWHVGSSTSRDGNFAWLQFGDGLRLNWCNYYSLRVNTSGQSSTTDIEIFKGENKVYDKPFSITINTAYHTIEEFIFDGEDITENFKDAYVEGDNFNTISMGFIRGGSVNWTIPNFLTSIEVLQEEQDVDIANYTVKFVDAEGKDVKTAATRSGVVGAAIRLAGADTQDFFTEDETPVKYIYESNDVEGKTILADGTAAVTVKFHKAATWNYTINATIGEQTVKIAEGSNFEKETIGYNFPRFYNLDGALYSKAAGSNDPGWYRGTFLLSEADQTVAVEGYGLVDTVRVAYFSEAEDIKGMTLSSNSTAEVRMSMGKTAYNAGKEAVKIVTLPAGTYRIMTTTWGSEGQNFVFKAGDQTILTAGCTGSSADASAVFTLTAETDVVLDAPVGEIFNGGIDYVLISNITPATVVENIAALKALPVGTMVRLTLKDTKITVKAATMMGTYTLLEDETGAALIPSTMFGDDLTTALPDVFANDSVALNGYLYAETIDMGGLCALGVCDSTSSSDITVTKTDLTPTTMEIADALKAENLLRYVKLENVTLDEKYVLTQGEATITVQDMMAVLELDDEYNLVVPEAAIDITGFVIDMGTGAMFVPIAPYTEHKADAISGVAADADALDGDVYNLSGVKVRNAGDSLDGLKGLYIINGKKVVLK